MADSETQEKERTEGIGNANNDAHVESDDVRSVEQENYPTGWRLWTIVAALVVGSFCYALDETIVATAVPRISDEFQAVGDVGWYGSAYLAACCVCQPIFGNLYRTLSVKRTFLGAAAIFEVGNAISGSAQSSATVIVGRAITGMGCGGLNAGVWLIVSKIVPLHRRPIYISAIGSIYGAAAVIGPLLGGFLTEYASWRWVFFINLPLGGLIFALLLTGYREDEADQRRPWRELLDAQLLASCVFFALAIICLLLALSYGGTRYRWSARQPVAFLVAFGVSSIVFFVLQMLRKDCGLIPIRLIKQRSIAAGLWYSFCAGSASTILIYFLPLWFQAVQGYSASKSGILTIPFLLGFVLFALVAGVIVSRTGYYVPCMLAGTVLLSLGAGLLSTLTLESSTATYVGFEILFAAGSGLGNNQPLLAVQTSLQPEDVAVGTATVALGQTLGGAIFLIVAQNIFSGQLGANLRQVGVQVTAADILQSGATELEGNAALDAIPQEVRLVAYNGAVVSVFLLAAGLGAATVLGSVAMEWRSVKKAK